MVPRWGQIVGSPNLAIVAGYVSTTFPPKPAVWEFSQALQSSGDVATGSTLLRIVMAQAGQQTKQTQRRGS